MLTSPLVQPPIALDKPRRVTMLDISENRRAAREAGVRHRSDCRKGLHTFGGKSPAGAGIERQVCARCGHVVIQLQDETEVEDSRLFSPGKADSMFAIQSALEDVYEMPERRFGVRPANRRVRSGS